MESLQCEKIKESGLTPVHSRSPFTPMERMISMLRRRWTSALYYTGLILLFLFIPAAIFLGTRGRGDDSYYGIIGAVIALLIFLAYLIFPNITGNRNK